jgi:hypothetical protein
MCAFVQSALGHSRLQECFALPLSAEASPAGGCADLEEGAHQLWSVFVRKRTEGCVWMAIIEVTTNDCWIAIRSSVNHEVSDNYIDARRRPYAD